MAISKRSKPSKQQREPVVENEILVDARTDVKRVALLENGRLMEIYYDDPKRARLVGNIYKGIVSDVLSGISAGFVNVGEDENLFLPSKELSAGFLRDKNLRRADNIPIGKVLKAGQQLIIQVKREGIGEKNPQGTTRISLAGRYWVFLPQDERLGVSRRIEEFKEARRLKEIGRELKRDGEGLIARTAAQGATQEDLERDFKFLLGTWKGILDKASKATAPKLIYQGQGVLKSIARDRLMRDVTKVVVDSKKAFDELIEFLKYLHMEEYINHVELYKGKKPLFEVRGVEEEIRISMEPKIYLPGGGSIIIAEMEALTAIDVNTGSDTRHRNQELAILNTNLEAAVEIPRQLRLRKISGIIVVDFIDMKEIANEDKLVECIKFELKKDRVPSDFIDITALGLIEITRKREGESLQDMLSDDNEEED
jgi:ribonuclease G